MFSHYDMTNRKKSVLIREEVEQCSGLERDIEQYNIDQIVLR